MDVFLLPPADRERLMSQLMRHEGTKRDRQGRHMAYRCPAGFLTIGYGHNLNANPIAGMGPDMRLSEDEARRLLTSDIMAVEGQLRRALPWAEDLAPARRAVLINMAFTMGTRGLLSFCNTLADLKRGDYAAASSRMMQSLWASQVGNRARELSRQMRVGEWT